MSHAPEIGPMKVHRFFGGIENVLLSTRDDVFFENIDEHIRVSYVGLAVHGKVRHLRIAEVQIPLPYFLQAGAVAAADISQQSVVIGPLCDTLNRNRLLLRAVAGSPEPAVHRVVGYS